MRTARTEYSAKCSSETVKRAQCMKLLSAILPNVTRITCDHRLSASALTKVPCENVGRHFGMMRIELVN